MAIVAIKSTSTVIVHAVRIHTDSGRELSGHEFKFIVFAEEAFVWLHSPSEHR